MSPHITRREFLRGAAVGAISLAALLGINYLLKGGLGSILSACSRKEEPISEPTPLPIPTNTEIKESIDDLLALGNEPVYDQGMDHTTEVLSLASKVYRALNEGRTLEQDNPIIRFLTNDEWGQKTSTPNRVRLRDAYGFLAWESTGSRKGEELTMYIRGNIPVWSALRIVGHEAGIAQVKRTEGPYFDAGDTNWYWARGEAAGFLSEVAFLRKMEEAGLEFTRYANTEQNRSDIKYVLEKGIWKNSEKDAHFDAEGQLNADDTTDITLGMWYGAAMFALDPSLADVKNRIELQGRTNPEDNMTLIKRIAGTTTYTFRDHYKSLLNEGTYNEVLKWAVDVMTSPERLNGNKQYHAPSLLFPANFLP